MENVFEKSGLSLEQLIEVIKDTIYEVCEKVDLKDIFRKVRAKHPEITDEQWGVICDSEENIPDLQDRAVVDQMIEELDLVKLMKACYSGVPDDEEPAKKK